MEIKKLVGACVLLMCSSSMADAPGPMVISDAHGMESESTAHAASGMMDLLKGFYVRSDFGGSIPATTLNNAPFQGKKYKSSPIYNFGVGYNICDSLRTDLNIQYRKFNYQTAVDGSGDTTNVKQGIKNFALFWNGYLDAKNPSIFTPYLTGGIGYSRLVVGAASSVVTEPHFTPTIDGFPGKSSNNFAWNGGVGTKMQVIGGLDLDLAYRYVGLGKIQFGLSNPSGYMPGKIVKLRTHEVTLGLAYNF